MSKLAKECSIRDRGIVTSVFVHLIHCTEPGETLLHLCGHKENGGTPRYNNLRTLTVNVTVGNDDEVPVAH